MELRNRSTCARGRARRGQPSEFDFIAQTGHENLARALILRLLTPRGPLATLGRAAAAPAWGNELIVLEAVAHEPRVEPN